MNSAMPSKPSLLLRSSILNFKVPPNTTILIVHELCDAIKAEFAAEVIQLKSGLLSSLRKNGNFHTAVVLWMASM